MAGGRVSSAKQMRITSDARMCVVCVSVVVGGGGGRHMEQYDRNKNALQMSLELNLVHC